jgi:putative hemolysin
MTELLLDAPDPYLTRVPGYHVRLAASEADVLAAQRLRQQVFAGECGADPSSPDRVEQEEFDDRCDHLIVWYHDGSTVMRAVATCRLLPPHSNDAAPRAAGLDANRQFGLMPLERLLNSTVEAGRGCVHPDHRSGAAVSLLAGGLARYLHLTGYRYLLGCASMDLSDGGRDAAAFWDLALTRHLAPAERRCRPRATLAIGGLARANRPSVPPLLRGYLRVGAKVCGPPAYNHSGHSADFLVLLDMRYADGRYLQRFLGTA